MTDYSQISIIYNPNSTGDGPGMARELKKELASFYKTLPLKLVPTKHAGHAETLAREIASTHKIPLIISASGDGGYNEVVNGVMKAGNGQAICAVLPAGNANDHSRTMQDEPLLDLIKKAKPKKIDLLKITINSSTDNSERFAHSYIGLGITPVIAAELNKHDLNAFREMKIVVQRFYKYRPFKIMRGKKEIKLNSLVFANINQMAKVLTLAKENKPDDGKFEVVTFPAQHKRKLVFSLLKAAATKLDTTRHETSYDFEVIKKMPIQLDGEVMVLKKGDKVLIESAHKVLKTLV
ncbi:MAG: diacylglycerol kinase [bacterium]|nr:diacylglycerol kinase [bacterium]